jgi:SAM-dependent methyltransferase
VQITEQELKELARQLRKPTGDLGKQVGERMNIGNAPMNLHTLAILNAGGADQILEIGMGNGFFVKDILTKSPDIQYTGCDYSEDMVIVSKELNESWIKKGRAKFVHSTAEDTGLSSTSFNKIFTVNTIYFWESPASILLEIKRLLRPGGELILSFRPENSMLELPVTAYGFNFYDELKVRKLLQEHGFSSLEATHVIEPEEELFGKTLKKECIIVKAILA